MSEIHNNEFYYPENLTAKTTFGAGWEWWAIAIMAAGLLLSVTLIIRAQLILPLIFTLVFMLCTFRVDDVSVYKTILIAANWLFYDQMKYFWQPEIQQKELICHGKK